MTACWPDTGSELTTRRDEKSNELSLTWDQPVKKRLHSTGYERITIGLSLDQARALRDALLAHFPIESDQSQPEPAGAAAEAGE